LAWTCDPPTELDEPLTTKKTRHATPAFEKTLANKSDGEFLLRLYVAGASVRSRQALRHVYRLCESELKGNYKLEVVDVYQQPERAREDQIVATPTLVKYEPAPVRRFIGNLSNVAGLFAESGPAPKGKEEP
jgi:circadian clock protein KaiB